MEYSTLGKTGLKVSRLSLGASSLGSVFRAIDEAEGIRAVHVATELGINYFDVAPAYGGTAAESVLGKALKGVPRRSYLLSTKVGKYTGGGYGQDILDYSRSGIRRSIDESLQRLGVEYLDIVHLHDIEYQRRAHTEWALSEGIEALHELKREGRIGAVSVGTYPMDLWRRIVSSVDVDAAMVHNHHCLNDTRALELLPIAAARDIGLINASPFASGLLTGREAPAWHPADEEDRRVFRQASEFCQRREASIAKLAMQFASQHPQIPTTMFSSASPESVRRNVRWHEEPCDMALVAQVQEILKPVMSKQWDYDAGVERVLRSGR